MARAPTWEFRAGQHVKLGLASLSARSYSIASAPSDPDLEFCIQLVPGGKLTPGLFALSAGARLELSGPKGKFLLDPQAHVHLMVATGTGIAPFRSMLRQSLANASTRTRFVIVHGASQAHGLPFRDELEQLAETNDAVEYVPTVSRPMDASNRAWRGRTGRADVVFEELWRTRDFSQASSIYACGNAGMIDNVRRWCRQHGRALRAEKFY